MPGQCQVRDLPQPLNATDEVIIVQALSGAHSAASAPGSAPFEPALPTY